MHRDSTHRCLIIILTLLIILLFGIDRLCFGQDCNKIPSTFSSYEKAKTFVKTSVFKIKETIDTSKSSWIRGAAFYSCDGQKGFLIIKTDKKDYIHQNVPIEIWREFKSATSFGSYYSNYIRGNYKLILSGQ